MDYVWLERRALRSLFYSAVKGSLLLICCQLCLTSKWDVVPLDLPAVSVRHLESVVVLQMLKWPLILTVFGVHFLPALVWDLSVTCREWPRLPFSENAFPVTSVCRYPVRVCSMDSHLAQSSVACGWKHPSSGCKAFPSIFRVIDVFAHSSRGGGSPFFPLVIFRCRAFLKCTLHWLLYTEILAYCRTCSTTTGPHLNLPERNHALVTLWSFHFFLSFRRVAGTTRPKNHGSPKKYYWCCNGQFTSLAADYPKLQQHYYTAVSDTARSMK